MRGNLVRDQVLLPFSIYVCEYIYMHDTNWAQVICISLPSYILILFCLLLWTRYPPSMSFGALAILPSDSTAKCWSIIREQNIKGKKPSQCFPIVDGSDSISVDQDSAVTADRQSQIEIVLECLQLTNEEMGNIRLLVIVLIQLLFFINLCNRDLSRF